MVRALLQADNVVKVIATPENRVGTGKTDGKLVFNSNQRCAGPQARRAVLNLRSMLGETDKEVRETQIIYQARTQVRCHPEDELVSPICLPGPRRRIECSKWRVGEVALVRVTYEQGLRPV